jgi:hypothetical protein
MTKFLVRSYELGERSKSKTARGYPDKALMITANREREYSRLTDVWNAKTSTTGIQVRGIYRQFTRKHLKP